jgi:mRNA interferase MazF
LVRGEIWRLRAPRLHRASEQDGQRFAVIVQADELLALSTVLVAPTSRSAPGRSFRPTIELEGQLTRVLVEQTTAVSTDRLGNSVGRLNAQEIRSLDDALAVVFGL